MSRIVLKNDGVKGEANTTNLFKAINMDLKLQHAKHVTIVTSEYHAPRVLRTAELKLRPNHDTVVLYAPHNSNEK